jgi:hypothetical protein
MLIFCDLLVLGCLTLGRNRLDLSFMALLRGVWPSTRALTARGQGQGHGRGSLGLVEQWLKRRIRAASALPGTVTGMRVISAKMQIACLDKLAAAIIAHEWTAYVITPLNGPVHLFVQDPGDRAMTAQVVIAPDNTSGELWYWFAWAERIDKASMPGPAAKAIVESVRRPPVQSDSDAGTSQRGGVA